jgi:hypothetical protein
VGLLYLIILHNWITSSGAPPIFNNSLEPIRKTTLVYGTMVEVTQVSVFIDISAAVIAMT